MSDLKEIILLIEIHDLSHPTHGLDCACLDRWIGQIRKMTTAQSSAKAQRRIDYVLRSACENRTPFKSCEDI